MSNFIMKVHFWFFMVFRKKMNSWNSHKIEWWTVNENMRHLQVGSWSTGDIGPWKVPNIIYLGQSKCHPIGSSVASWLFVRFRTPTMLSGRRSERQMDHNHVSVSREQLCCVLKIMLKRGITGRALCSIFNNMLILKNGILFD